VIDFTTWTEEEVKNFFRKSSSSTCGRFHINQLKTYTFHDRSVKRQNAWLPLSFLGCSLLFSGYTAAQSAQPTETSVKQGEVSASTDLAKTTSRSKTISGTVRTKEDDSSLPGVNIVLKGRVQETTTDADGKFSITISEPSPNDTLVISFIGYKTLEYPVALTQSAEVILHLELDTEALNSISGIAGAIVVGGARSYSALSPRGIWWRIKSLFRR
jgi:hypothetical protein